MATEAAAAESCFVRILIFWLGCIYRLYLCTGINSAFVLCKVTGIISKISVILANVISFCPFGGPWTLFAVVFHSHSSQPADH